MKIFLLCFISVLITQKIFAQVSGVKTIPGDYSSITAAVQHLRTVGVSGSTFLELQAGYNSAVEIFPIKIREIPGTSVTNSVTISPAAGAAGISITSANSGGIIELIGAYNIIIDGRPGRTGSGRELTIRSNSTIGKAISFLDGAVGNSVAYCKLEGSAAGPFSEDNDESVVYFGRSTEPIPDGILLENTNNSVSNCIVRGVSSPKCIIYANGTSAVLNAGNKILNNELLNFFVSGIIVSQDGGTGWTITGNSFYNTNPSTASIQTPVNFQPGAGSVNNIISGNFIGGQAPQAGGGQWVAEGGNIITVWGINIDAGSVVVEDNIVQNFRLENDAHGSGFIGINLIQGSAQIRGNRIGAATEAIGIKVRGSRIGFQGIRILSCSPVYIDNNRISNITVEAFFPIYFFGIICRAGSGTVITGNQVDQVTANSTGTVNFTAIGTFPIAETAQCPVSPQPSIIDHNLIDNITLSSDEDSASFNGIEITGTSGPVSLLHYNQVYKINVSSPNGIASFTGVNVNDRLASNTGNIIGSATETNSIMVTGELVNAVAILVNQSPDASISDDIIGNITINGTLSASLDGIRFMGGGVSKVSGNQLNDLSVSSAGWSTMIGISFNGAVTASEPSTLHNNKVFKINVSSTDGTASFTGININDRISGNTGNIIGSATETNSIMVTGKSAIANGIRLKNSPDVSVSDDIIANIAAIGTETPASVNGIVFESGATAKISGNNVHHLAGSETKGIFIQPSNGSSTVTLERNTLTGNNDNTGTGFETFVTSGASLNITATNNTVSNWQIGVLLAAASGATLQQSFQNNAVVANQTGFVNENGTPVNATCNWWGHASGPSGAGPGTGNPVGPNVIFSPWATISTYVAVNAGPDQTIIGSGSKTLTPTYTVCGTAIYLWSTGATTPSITVSPTVTTVYSIKITEANGHEATDEVTVFVQTVAPTKINMLNTVVIEGNSGTNTAIFILYLSKISSVPVTVQYTTGNITATAPQDYVQKSGTVTFPANNLVGVLQTITVQVKGDAVAELDETFKVTLSNAVNATISDATATCTIVDNDPPCLRIIDTTATENSQQAVVRVSLTSASSRIIRVRYDTKDGTAKAPADYTKVNNGVLTFQPGETSKNITIVVKKDALNESTEKFQVILKEPENASIVTTSYCTPKKDATVSILNSAPQQNREIWTETPLADKEETLDITVPGILRKYSQLTIYGLKGMDNDLMIFDSKGIVIAKLPQYRNSWSPGKITPGIYFYQLRVRIREGKYEVYRGKIFITD